MKVATNCNITDKEMIWFKKQAPRSCGLIKKYILDVRIAMEECKNDEECVAVSDEGCNMKGSFGVCKQLGTSATFSSANNCVYQKKKGKVRINLFGLIFPPTLIVVLVEVKKIQPIKIMSRLQGYVTNLQINYKE